MPDRAMQEFGVCWYHGGKAARTSMRLAAFPESPAAAAARKHKQRTHHARKAVFLESGRRLEGTAPSIASSLMRYFRRSPPRAATLYARPTR